MVAQNGHGSQVLASATPFRIRDHFVMWLQRLDKGMRTTRVLPSSLNKTGRDVRDHAWWSGHILPKGGSQAFSACVFHCLHRWRVAVRTNLQRIRSFRSELRDSNNQRRKNPGVERRQGSSKALLSCRRSFVFALFPRTTGSVARRPLLTAPEASLVDRRFCRRIIGPRAKRTTGFRHLPSRGAGRCARVPQAQSRQIDNVFLRQQKVDHLQNQKSKTFQQQVASHQGFRRRGARNNLLELDNIILIKNVQRKTRGSR